MHQLCEVKLENMCTLLYEAGFILSNITCDRGILHPDTAIYDGWWC